MLLHLKRKNRYCCKFYKITKYFQICVKLNRVILVLILFTLKRTKNIFLQNRLNYFLSLFNFFKSYEFYC